MLSQFFILSSRGDTLAFRYFRSDVVRGTPEIFYRRIKSFKSAHPNPVFNVEGTQFIHIVQSGLYFVCTTTQNASPVFVLELLNKIARVCKDYLGVLNEEALRANFALVYEILDEILDFGYPQCTSTELLKEYIFNESHPLQINRQPLGQFTQASAATVFGAEKRSTPSSAPNKSVLTPYNKTSGMKNEVFIDMLENLTVLVSATGHVVRSEIDGCIKIRSFLAGNPEIRIGLNENLRVRNSHYAATSLGNEVTSVLLDDCCFHDCVDVDEFDRSRTLVFKPPTGEYSVMTYRMMGDVNLPFRIHPFMEVLGEKQIVLRLKLSCDIPKMFNAVGVTVSLPAPKSTENVTHEVTSGTNSLEYKAKERIVYWNLKKMMGGSEHSANIKFTVPIVTNMSKKEVGPISLNFELPLFVCSKLQIKHLKITERDSMYTPMRWVRYITHSDSYVTRV